MIDILVPVLGRPQNARPLVNSIEAATTVSFRINWVFTDGDHEQITASMATETGIPVTIAPGRGEYPRKMNEAYRYSDAWSSLHYPFVFLAADDLEFTVNWDHHLLDRMADPAVGVIATNDRANSQVKRGEFGTHCLIRRSYIDDQGGSLDGPGTVFHEGYDHNFVDRELCGLAQSRGQYAFARNSVVRHRHPLHDPHVPMDDTYKKGLANFQADRDLFFQRAAQWGYVGLSPQERRVARNMQAKARQ